MIISIVLDSQYQQTVLDIKLLGKKVTTLLTSATPQIKVAA